MSTFKVNVKWGKEKFQDVELDLGEPPEVFKAQLFALSGVQPSRQKVMVKGVVIKDDDWGNVKLKDGVTLLMMGSAEELPKEPVEKTMFVEDMTEGQLATALELPPGLHNLGNTCYMNATLQCLRAVPELKESLKSYTGSITGGAINPDETMTAAIRDLYSQMDQGGEAFPPLIMVRMLHMCYPQFAEKNDQGTFQQQDANECWTNLVHCLQRKLPSKSVQQMAAAAASKGFIDQYMGGEFSITMKCIENEEESVTYSQESFYQISCFIDKDVKYLSTGLKSRLEDHISKHSASLGRDAQYLKSCKINRLPGYLAVQMVRFFYKEKEGVNAKILKDVKFPLALDMYEMCTEDLQKKLAPMREKFKETDDRAAERISKAKSEGKEVEKRTNTTKEPYSFPDDIGSNNSGYYELQAVLTHKGRSSSSGHYVGWSRRKGDEWMMYDDQQVTPVTSDDIVKLSGGGDWHCAYVLLYGPRQLELDNEPAKADTADTKKEESTMETD